LNVAVTDLLPVMATVQVVAEFESQPVQVTPEAPVPIAALRTTVEFRVKTKPQVPGQLIPVGELVTVPLPLTLTVKAPWLQAEVPMPDPVRNAEPLTKFGGAFKLAVKFPLPQMLVEVTKPELLTVARF